MKLLLHLVAILLVTCGFAQTVRQNETFRGLTSPQAVSDTLPAPKYLQDHVVDGKLRLSLQDAIIAMLMNNSNVRIQELNVENAKYSLLGAHSKFDPLVQAGFAATRATFALNPQAPGSLLQSSSLTQISTLDYRQVFETGTIAQVGFNATRFWDSSSQTFNPSIASGLNFQLTQSLLRNRWLFANRAPLVIARRNLRASQSIFEGQVNDAILNVVTQYWAVVQSRGNLEVAKKSQD